MHDLRKINFSENNFSENYNNKLFNGPAFFQTALPRSGGLSPEEGWDAVAVGVNRNMGATTEHQDAARCPG